MADSSSVRRYPPVAMLPRCNEPESDVSVLPEQISRVDRLPPYNLVLHNDPYHTFDFVISVLCQVFHYPVQKSMLLALEAHEKERSIVWSGGKELGELKLEQMNTFHEGKLGPVGCHLEPGV